jgi:hypothetical protein
VDMKLEVLVMTVADVDRAKRFYETLGFRLDIDHIAGGEIRVVQLTLPRSERSIIIIGNGSPQQCRAQFRVCNSSLPTSRPPTPSSSAEASTSVRRSTTWAACSTLETEGPATARQTMTNLHRLRPCTCCPTRMAVPGTPLCTVCDVTLAARVPDNVSALVA